MAKAKSKAADGGATKKQATTTKNESAEEQKPGPAKGTKAEATTKKAAASTGKASAAGSAATRKKASAKPAGSPAGGGVPHIDTSLAAHAAASFIANRSLLGPAQAVPQPSASDSESDSTAGNKRETSTFKQLKAGLNKPAGQGFGGLLGGGVPGKKGNTGFSGGPQQTGRNQTYGADVNRSGVPRRTGG